MIGPQAPSLTAAPTGSRLHLNFGTAARAAPQSLGGRHEETAVRGSGAYSGRRPGHRETQRRAIGGLPNRLLTAFEVAEFIGCHEETVRRAYSRGLLTSQRFGVRGRRFHPADVLDWIKRGAPTRVS